MMRWPTVLAIVTVLAAGAIALLAATRSDAATTTASPDDGLYTVARGDLAITLTENGSLVAKDSREVVFQAQRGGKITWLVEAGREVAEGEEVCRLDTADLEAAVQQSELDVNQAEADSKTAQTELALQGTENEASLVKARIALEKATKDLERYKAGDGPQERRKLEIALKDAQTEFGRKKKFLEDSKRLVGEGFLRQSELEDHEIAFEKAQVQLEGAQLELEMFDRYKDPMTRGDKEVALTDAKRELDATAARNETRLLQRQVAETKAAKQLLQHKKKSSDLRRDIGFFTLRAPCAGMVLHGNPKQPWYADQIKIGGELYESMTVCTIPDLRVMQVKLKVHEADLSKLRPDLDATVTMDSYPGVVLKGKLTRIASIATRSDFGGDDGVKKFDAEVTLEAREGLLLRPGISAKVTLSVDNLTDVLFVPLQCVALVGGEHACFVRGADGAPQRRVVQVGPSSDNYVSIQGGLEVGERVLLYNPSLSRKADPPAGDAAK